MPFINMPKLSDTMTEGTVARWLKKEGDRIEMGDILAEIETDKATMEMESFDEGVLKEILVKDGGKIGVGQRMALILDEGEVADAPAEKSEAKSAAPVKDAPKSTAPTTEPTPAAPPTGSRVKASPLAKKIAAERGVSLDGVAGSGPDGRIVAKDVPESGSAPKSADVPAPIRLEKTGGEERRIELSGMRRVIADRLLASKTQIPHFYLSIEVDAAPLMRLRAEVNTANEAGGQPKITVNDFVLLAVARAAQQCPKVNSAWGGDHVVEYGSVNICVAVAVDDGLVTPVIRNAQSLSLREISAAVKDLAKRARNKKLKPEEFSGGTLTVSNLGAYGIEQFYAIVNPPQAAILAVGAIVKKPIVNAKDEIVIGQRMSVSLSGDHRVVDGAVGAEYLAALRKLIENPALMLF
ncbi:MAG: pyruvate dehydrogenase complex dihydrolipoamide acetyltransferase [Terrimicrobiaceae bacterium]|nr:pyruvate dehydrogenase complex dihydrolipoamide acetyltransferase [Terrimicrobiaceae bacterium]